MRINFYHERRFDKKGQRHTLKQRCRMISNLSVSVPFQRGRDTAVYCNGKIGDDYIWVILHVVLDPVQHKPHKGIFIEICKEFLVFVAHVHAFGFFRLSRV